MKEQDKELLLKDLCTRLPYGVMMGNKTLKETSYRLSGKDIDDAEFDDDFDDLPYLRPMSSMTEEEKKEYKKVIESLSWTNELDFLNKYHFDYHGLIPIGFALEAPEGMYNIK